jgi:hypothetical protein
MFVKLCGLMTDDDRRRRLEEALGVAERVGNTFLANNIRKALEELLGGSEKGR